MFAVLLLHNMNRKRRISTLKSASSSVNMMVNDVESVYCRTCLSNEDLVAIFYSKETEELRARDLFLVTGLQIRINDGLSQKICITCTEKIDTALEFRRSCLITEKTILKMIKKKPNKKKIKDIKPIDVPDIELPAKLPFDENLTKLSFESTPEVSQYDAVANWSPTMKYDDNFDYDMDYPFDDNSDVKDDIDIIVRKKTSPKTNKQSRKLKKHMYITSPYKCTTCNKEFRMKATYKAHMRFHTNFCVCESCGKRCRNNNQLQEHKRAKHGLGRIHKCAYCEYTSATKEALTIHERRHTGERPYICDHCGATFHRRSNLVQHIAIHLPEKNFQCDMCPKRLKSKKFLQIHRHNAHTGRRYGYVCALCEHVFEKPNKVRAHVRRVHAVPEHDQPPVRRIQL